MVDTYAEMLMHYMPLQVLYAESLAHTPNNLGIIRNTGMSTTASPRVLLSVVATFCALAVTPGRADGVSAISPMATSLVEEGCDTCVETFEQCGDSENTTAACCSVGDVCVAKNVYYAQCLHEADAVARMSDRGWDGSPVECGVEGIPIYPPQKPADETCMSEGITECAAQYDQCGGNNLDMILPCCVEGFECIVKNSAYAQCIPVSRIALNVASGWQGDVLGCDGSLSPPPTS